MLDQFIREVRDLFKRRKIIDSKDIRAQDTPNGTVLTLVEPSGGGGGGGNGAYSGHFAVTQESGNSVLVSNTKDRDGMSIALIGTTYYNFPPTLLSLANSIDSAGWVCLQSSVEGYRPVLVFVPGNVPQQGATDCYFLIAKVTNYAGVMTIEQTQYGIISEPSRAF